jgi:hypothetical protein
MEIHGSAATLVADIDSLHVDVCRSQRAMFGFITRADQEEVWRGSGARDMAHWLQIRYGISGWKARRWIAAAHALEELPVIAEAFARGEIGLDKVVELARFATRSSESSLLAWARCVSAACIRRRADLAVQAPFEEVTDAYKARFCSWWYFDEGRRFGLEAELPAAEGAAVAKALERLAEQIPVMPGEEHACHADARRADALVGLCSASIAADADPDRATVMVYAELADLDAADRGFEVEGGGVVHTRTIDRLLCTARVQAVIEDDQGNPVRLGRVARTPSQSMMRQLRYRDKECRFPGCGSRRFTQGHHIVWWKHGGTTDLDNLVLICTFHHRLVHEYGWGIHRDAEGVVLWTHPDGTRFHAGPAPPVTAQDDRQAPLVKRSRAWETTSSRKAS